MQHRQSTYTYVICSGDMMETTAFQKIAFVVLLALMFGVTTGVLGGL